MNLKNKKILIIKNVIFSIYIQQTFARTWPGKG